MEIDLFWGYIIKNKLGKIKCGSTLIGIGIGTVTGFVNTL
jgi:hypothetical protein